MQAFVPTLAESVDTACSSFLIFRQGIGRSTAELGHGCVAYVQVLVPTKIGCPQYQWCDMRSSFSQGMMPNTDSGDLGRCCERVPGEPFSDVSVRVHQVLSTRLRNGAHSKSTHEILTRTLKARTAQL